VALVFDIGMHEGEDTRGYLARGHRVVAVEANPRLADAARARFRRFVERGQLIVRNVGIGEREGTFPFFVCRALGEWSSFDETLARRGGAGCDRVDIPCLRLERLFDEHGTPRFVKVDIEGSDLACVSGLPARIVRYVSVEAGDLAILERLVEKGYTRFKLLNQAFGFRPIDLALERNPLFPRFLHLYNGARRRLRRFWPSRHPLGSSGPFGEETRGRWLSAREIEPLYRAFFVDGLAARSRSWFDLHATW